MLKGHSAGVRALAFSPDGTMLASGSSDRTVRLWDVPTYKERSRLRGHKDAVLAIAFSRGRQGAGVGRRGRHGEALEPRQRRAARPVAGARHACSPPSRCRPPARRSSPAGAMAWPASGTWKRASGYRRSAAMPPTRSSRSPWPRTGAQLLTAGDRSVKLYAAALGEVRAGSDAARAPGGRCGSPCTRPTARRWRPAATTGRCGCGPRGRCGGAWPCRATTAPVYGASFSPDGKTLALGCEDGTIKSVGTWPRASSAPP